MQKGFFPTPAPGAHPVKLRRPDAVIGTAGVAAFPCSAPSTAVNFFIFGLRVVLKKLCLFTKFYVPGKTGGARHPRHLNARVSALLLLK